MPGFASVALDGRGTDIDLMAVDHMGDEIHELPRMRERRGTPP
jgi:hypothetical protein